MSRRVDTEAEDVRTELRNESGGERRKRAGGTRVEADCW